MEPASAQTDHAAVLPLQEQCRGQVQKILQSSAFRNAFTLQQLLQYLATKAYEHETESLKEYTIGVEVLGRPHDFDPKTDTIVRVQIHRLRQKLKEYYETGGSRDPIFIDIPKGHYVPTFETARERGSESNGGPARFLGDRASAAAITNGHDKRKTSSEAEKEVLQPGPHLPIRALIATSVVIAVFALGFWAANLRNRLEHDTVSANANAGAARPADPVKAFWSTFLGSDTTPVVAYPDAVFLLDDSNDLFRFRRGASDDRGSQVDPHLAIEYASNPSLISRAGQLYYENEYLGAGELKAVGALSNLFGQMGIRPIIKPSREITPDDLTGHNVIMLGSSFQNFAVAQLSTSGDFTFKNPDSRLEQWRGMIVNSHPLPTEASTYHTERDPMTRVLKTDYSLITVQPGVAPGRYIATLGGLDTTGTEGAVLFATSKPGVEELARALASAGISSLNGTPPQFQALVSVHLEKGYDVLGASLVAVHALSPAHPHTDSGSLARASTH